MPPFLMLRSVHIKVTDKDQYLHFQLARSDHSKILIIYTQSVRVSGICTLESNCEKQRDEMNSRFSDRFTLNH